MNSSNSISLAVGDQVRFRESDYVQAKGVVVELLANDYVRVLWDDVAALSTHQAHSLIAVLSAAQQIASGNG